MAEVYSTDHDINDIRPGILELGQQDFTHLHQEAKRLIDRDLKIKWYRNARKTLFHLQRPLLVGTFGSGTFHQELDDFDPELFLNATLQFKLLGSYKALGLIYQTLEKAITDDPYRAQRLIFDKQYEAELTTVIQSGIDYDWDKDASIEPHEKGRRIFSGERMVRG